MGGESRDHAPPKTAEAIQAPRSAFSLKFTGQHVRMQIANVVTLHSVNDLEFFSEILLA